MSDPFGDGNPVEGDIPQEISDFAPPVDNSNDFYEVEPTEATTNGTYEEHTEQSFDQHDEESFEQHQESYQPMDFAPAPFEDVPAADFQAEIPAAPMEIPAQIPVVEEDNELTKFMREYEEKIALKAQEQEKVAVECKSKAEEDMAQFLAERQRIKESKMQANRVFEQATLEKMVADLQNENPWERVVTLVDLETSRKKKLDALNNNNKKDGKKQDPKPVAVPAKKTKEDEEDVSRMRQLFVQLKATPLEQTRADAVAAN